MLKKANANKSIVYPAHLQWCRLQKTWFFTPVLVLYVCKYWFAKSTHVCNLLLIDFDKKAGFECCFWSTQCIDTQARMSYNVKTGVFISLKIQRWSFIDNVVYCNNWHSIKAAFLELEKAMFTGGAILVPMFTIITPGPYTHSKQSKAIHAKFILKVNCEKKWLW